MLKFSVFAVVLSLLQISLSQASSEQNLTESHANLSSSPTPPESVTEEVAEAMEAEVQTEQPTMTDSDDGTLKVEGLFPEAFTREFSKLALAGRAKKIPWTGNRLATYQDGLNDPRSSSAPILKLWSESPVQKYSKAYLLNKTDVENTISAFSGIDSIKNGTKCTSPNDCRHIYDVCAFRGFSFHGKCVSTLTGLDHARAAASIMEDEPSCSVKVKQTQFGVNDIKNLMTQMYAASPISTVVFGKNCSKEHPTSDNSRRFELSNCRDIDPHVFHLALSHAMGQHGKSIVANLKANGKILNRPIAAFKVEQSKKMSVNYASQKYFNGKNVSNSKSEAYDHLIYVKTKVDYVRESDLDNRDSPSVGSRHLNRFVVSAYYEYLLKLDISGQIVGGKWVGESMTEHPDFVWIPLGKPSLNDGIAGIEYKTVANLLERSLKCQMYEDGPEFPVPSEEIPWYSCDNHSIRRFKKLCEWGLFPTVADTKSSGCFGCLGKVKGSPADQVDDSAEDVTHSPSAESATNEVQVQQQSLNNVANAPTRLS